MTLLGFAGLRFAAYQRMTTNRAAPNVFNERD
jgi:hypothetical protein